MRINYGSCREHPDGSKSHDCERDQDHDDDHDDRVSDESVTIHRNERVMNLLLRISVSGRQASRAATRTARSSTRASIVAGWPARTQRRSDST